MLLKNLNFEVKVCRNQRWTSVWGLCSASLNESVLKRVKSAAYFVQYVQSNAFTHERTKSEMFKYHLFATQINRNVKKYKDT